MHSSPGSTCPSPYHFTCFLEGRFLAPSIIFLICLFTLPVPALLLGNPAPPNPPNPRLCLSASSGPNREGKALYSLHLPVGCTFAWRRSLQGEDLRAPLTSSGRVPILWRLLHEGPRAARLGGMAKCGAGAGAGAGSFPPHHCSWSPTCR